MPQVATEELSGLILNGKIGAISIDTSIFDRYQCNFGSPALSALEQFRDKHIGLLISEIVAGEVKAHLERDSFKSQRDLKSAIAAHVRRWRLVEDLADPFLLEQAATDFATDQFDEFVASTGAELVPAARSAAVGQRVVERYFAVTAPFEQGEKKKNEFPDAFALLSLEEWAADAEKMVLCVSADTGWHDFAGTSDWLICVEQLDPILDEFNEAGRATASKAVELLRAENAPKVWAEIERAFERRLDDLDFDVSVSDAPTQYDFQQISAVMQTIDWALATPNVLEEDEETVLFSVRVNALIKFTVHFDFYVRDSVDRDDVHLGGEEFTSQRWLGFDLAITVWRDMSEEIDAVEVTASRRGMTALFERIDPFTS